MTTTTIDPKLVRRLQGDAGAPDLETRPMHHLNAEQVARNETATGEGFRYDSGRWYRQDNGGKVCVARRGDVTPASSSALVGDPDAPFEYRRECGCCYLGILHSEALHRERVADAES